jgi:SAM-dependent methyltransferase
MPRLVETTTTCCVCGWRAAERWRTAGDHILGSPRQFRAVRCVRCGTARLDPRPDLEEMNRYYTADTYARAEEEEEAELAARLNEYNRRMVERVLQSVSEDVPRHALDIGCGDGRFLATLAGYDWEVTGVETEENAARLARQRTGGTVLQSPVETADLPENHFGLVSLLHVIEHVPDPRETLTTALRLLAPGGTLLLALPNAGSFEAKFFRSVWYPLDLPRHFWGFTPHTLTRLVEEVGFHVECLHHFPFLFAPQSLRYTARALAGKSPAGDQKAIAHPKPKNERNGLRTKAFLSLLTFSERLGKHLPGEVMELVAHK